MQRTCTLGQHITSAAGDGDAPGNDCHLLVGKLANVHARCLVGLVQAPLEQVRKLVELAELPLRIRGVRAATDVRRVLVILLII